MMKLVCEYYEKAFQALENGADILFVSSLKVREKIGRFKYVKEEEIQEEYDNIIALLSEELGGEDKED